MRLPPIFIASALLTGAACCAARDLSVEGVGTASCSNWLESHSNQVVREKYQEWILGFVTAHNYYGPGPASQAMAGASTWTAVDAYCKKNPKVALFGAAAALVQITGGTKAGHIWKK